MLSVRQKICLVRSLARLRIQFYTSGIWHEVAPKRLPKRLEEFTRHIYFQVKEVYPKCQLRSRSSSLFVS